MLGKSHCDFCGDRGLRIRDTCKINGKRLCKKCYRENKRDHRTLTRSMKLGGKYADRNFRPYTKKKKAKRYGNLTWEEKQVLFKQFTKVGMGEEDAKMRVKNLSTFEKRLFKRIITEKKSQLDLNKRFKEEFIKLR